MPTEDHPLPLCETLAALEAGRVLDVAAGVGQFTRALVDCLGAFEEIVGVDISPQAVERANASLDERGVSFEVADAAALPYPDGRFDTVVLANSLHHLKDLEVVASEIRRVLTPGGRWILLEMHDDASTPASRNAVDLHLWAAALDRARGQYHDPVFSRERLLRLLNELGLHDARILEWQTDDAPEDRDGIVKIIRTVLRHADGLPEEETLTTEAERLIARIRAEGMQSQPFVLYVGTV